jgi:ubiquitin C-terminal hydrolase
VELTKDAVGRDETDNHSNYEISETLIVPAETKYMVLHYQLFVYNPETKTFDRHNLEFNTSSAEFVMGLTEAEDETDRLEVRWRPVSVICKSGPTMQQGHYWAYRLQDGVWYETNDTSTDLHTANDLAGINNNHEDHSIFMICCERIIT